MKRWFGNDCSVYNNLIVIFVRLELNIETKLIDDLPKEMEKPQASELDERSTSCLLKQLKRL